MQQQEDQEPIVLKNGFKIYPWDVADMEKIGGVWTIQLRTTHVPLVISNSREKEAYAQIERIMKPRESDTERIDAN